MGQSPLHTGCNVAGGTSKRPHPSHICEFIPWRLLGFPWSCGSTHTLENVRVVQGQWIPGWSSLACGGGTLNQAMAFVRGHWLLALLRWR